MAKGLWVKIRKFEEYKGRKDVTHNSWFRCSNRLLEDSDLFDFTHEELLVWVYLLSIASQKNSAVIHVSHQHAHHVCRLSPKAVDSAIEKLTDLKCLERVRTRTLRGRYVDDTQTCATDITDITDKTDMVRVPAPPSPTPMGVYVQAYQEKYGIRPEVGAREGKILKTFSENHPDRWQELIRGYLQMPDSWAVARSHPVEVLVAKVNEVGRFLATGKVVTRKVIEHAEEAVDKAQGTLRKPRKSIEELEAEHAAMLAEASVVRIGGAK